LAACRARFALVGGLAVSVRAESRFTRDVDLAVAVASDAEAEALLGALMARGYRVLAHVIHESRERLATARLSLPERAAAEGVVLGLLFASSGIEAELVESAEDIEVFDGVMVPVARLPGLLATKILSSIDARGLLAEATPEEIEAARDLLRRVEAGGFHRSKSLLAELDALLDA
jgi:predicted nucleotidyltransferase